MLSMEDFIQRTQYCTKLGELSEVYRQDMEAEGYQNIVFLRVIGGRSVEAPWAVLPDGFLNTYLSRHLDRNDPILLRQGTAQSEFYWSDIAVRSPLKRQQLTALDAFRSMGVHSGLSIPFRGPDGQTDVINLSQRTQDAVDRARTAFIRAKSFVVWRRFWELIAIQEMAGGGGTEENVLKFPVFRLDLPNNATAFVHRGGPRGMTHAHCRTLVLVDTASRRWKIGLTNLNSRLLHHHHHPELEYLRDQGLISEVAGDDRRPVCLAPTALGLHHLQVCPDVARFRRDVWRLDVGRDEHPLARGKNMSRP